MTTENTVYFLSRNVRPNGARSSTLCMLSGREPARNASTSHCTWTGLVKVFEMPGPPPPSSTRAADTGASQLPASQSLLSDRCPDPDLENIVVRTSCVWAGEAGPLPPGTAGGRAKGSIR